MNPFPCRQATADITGVPVRIESLGVELPEKILTMEALLASCRRRPRWDLERITGIHERRVAEGEYAVDLGIRAARRALAMSRYRAEELDVLISAGISKYHREQEFHLEPATAVRIRAAVGAGRARVFDVVNACAGLLTGVHILRAMIACGQARCGMVVSGERNLPLAETAAREMRHSFDGQLAALTLGDAGAALILDRSPDPRAGFRHLELVTGAKHDHFCYSRPSRRGPGGILVTKARGLQRKGNEHFPVYFKRALESEKIWEVVSGHHEESELPAAAQGSDHEDVMVRGAITTDFILSGFANDVQTGPALAHLARASGAGREIDGHPFTVHVWGGEVTGGQLPRPPLGLPLLALLVELVEFPAESALDGRKGPLHSRLGQQQLQVGRGHARVEEPVLAHRPVGGLGEAAEVAAAQDGDDHRRRLRPRVAGGERRLQGRERPR